MSPENYSFYILDPQNIWYHEDHGYFRFLGADYDPFMDQPIIWFQAATIGHLETTPDPSTRFGYRASYFQNIILPEMRLVMGYTPEGINTIHPN